MLLRLIKKKRPIPKEEPQPIKKEEISTLTRGKNLLASLAAMSLVILFTLFVVAIGLEIMTSITGSIVTMFGYFGAKGFGGLVRS